LSPDAKLATQLAGVAKLGVLVDLDENHDKSSFEALRKPLTLRHLLTHSSGLAYEFTNPKIQRWRSANPVVQGNIGVEARFTTPLSFQLGEG
jgi:CubicO group peptidase (beta-lactamase class C family)